MSVEPAWLRALAATRLRCGLIAAALWAPVAIALGTATPPLLGAVGGRICMVAGMLGFSVLLRRAWHRADERWFARRLDAHWPPAEDSSALLFTAPQALGGLASLQRARVAERAAQGPLPDLRPAWPWDRIALAWLLSTLAVAAAVVYSRLPTAATTAPPAATQTASPATRATATEFTSIHVDIAPPAYTGLPPAVATELDAKLPEGSTLRWRLRFAPQPRGGAALVFHDGKRLALQRDGEDWTATQRVDASALYRVELVDAPPPRDDRLHRLDVIPDQPPEIRVVEPDRTLTLLTNAQQTWNLVFEANDDYGLGNAKLELTLAQGSGENVKFKDSTLALRGDGSAKARRYTQRIDLKALGLEQGDDLVVRLSLTDNRAPTPNESRSASFILRWPPEADTDSTGMDGLVRTTLPAYFRSQRQIIIDTEALLKEQPKLAHDDFVTRSDAIGVDQKVLRLRYGQFLGEEFETHVGPGDDHEDHQREHEKGHPAKKSAPVFGEPQSITEDFGHVHDEAEAATLLDPDTKRILKAALEQMWQSEMHLRMGEPQAALPYEYKALEHIKQVQQATRIYLARVGLELPPIDESRRLSGDRKGVTDRREPLAPAPPTAPEAAALWQALEGAGTPDTTAFERWLAPRSAEVPDALGLVQALDALRREPGCARCRSALRDRLWPLLPTPPAATRARPAPDAAGRAYLDALDAETRR